MARFSNDRTVFPFLKLGAELRNQIYQDIIGPAIPRPTMERWDARRAYMHNNTPVETTFWPDRKFNTALLFLNRQINEEFSHILWKVLRLEWKIHYELLGEELCLLASMKRLQRCKLVLDIDGIYMPDRRLMGEWQWRLRRRGGPMVGALEVEKTVFGLAHWLNRMPQLQELHLDYRESEEAPSQNLFVRFQDESLFGYVGSDIKDVLAADLQGVKRVDITGTLCAECAALFASAIESPKDITSGLKVQNAEQIVPRYTVPQWNDKIRNWI